MEGSLIMAAGPYRLPVALALFSSPSQSGFGQWGFSSHTVCSVDQGDHRVRPQVVGFITIWNDC